MSSVIWAAHSSYRYANRSSQLTGLCSHARPARCDNERMSRRIVTPVVIAVGVIAGGTVLARLLGYKLGGDVVVRCRRGHMFTTIWIPGVKLKGLDLVVARIQYCPVGKHWSLVVPVRDVDLTEGERQFARAHHDLPIP
jgi:hypothetical protein